MAGVLKPGKTWGLKHVTAPRYHISGPPQDIVGIHDDRYIDNPYQRRLINDLKKRDEFKFIGSKDYEYVDEDQYPDEPAMPNNQRSEWYEQKGKDANLQYDNGSAYWFYLVAAKKAKTYMRRRQLDAVAASHLKTWRIKRGYA